MVLIFFFYDSYPQFRMATNDDDTIINVDYCEGEEIDNGTFIYII